MAKKGQKFKSYSKEIKAEILKKYFEEYVPTTVLGEEYLIITTGFYLEPCAQRITQLM